MDDLLKVFLAETTECLGEIDADATALRSSPDDPARLDKVVSLLRSVRETSGFLGLPTLHVVARAPAPPPPPPAEPAVSPAAAEAPAPAQVGAGEGSAPPILVDPSAPVTTPAP